jgi:UDP-sugar pyrophosphorylase
MYNTGTASKIREKGCRYIITCNDTNPLSFRFLASYLGLIKQKNLHLAYLAIPRVPNEAVGALCTLKGKNQTFTTNIEYNFMEQILKKGNEPVDSKTGYSLFPGNTNIMIIELDEYIEVLKETGGQVPEFIGPKFAEGSSDMVSPARLESLVAEYPYLLKKNQKVGVINLDRLMVFTCAKNSIENGITKRTKSLPIETLASCEFDWYYANCLLLKKVCKVEFGLP